MGNMIELSHNDKNFPVYAVNAKGNLKGGLIVIHEVWGLTDHIKDVANRFAEQGYEVVSPDLLSETGITKELIGDLNEQLFDPERRTQAQPKVRELMAPTQAPGFAETTIQKIQKCFEYLSNKLGQDMGVAITGFCFGGTYSFSMAVKQPNLRVAVPFYGHSDFSVDELKNIKCPVLAFYGENDERLVEDLPELTKKMKLAGVDFTSVVYQNCGHAFFNDANRFSYNEVAAKDAWDKALNFLEANI